MMRDTDAWVTGNNAALLTDLYELTMAQAYFDQGMADEAVFSLFVRRLPKTRNYLLACGLETVLGFLEQLHFNDDAIVYLREQGLFKDAFLDRLRQFRFTGDVYAVPEGTPVFENEPLMEVVAPITEGQIVETFVMTQIAFQTVLASKAARVVKAAAGQDVRGRIHAGNVERARRLDGCVGPVHAPRSEIDHGPAGRLFGVPIAGTMAHSFVEAFDHEADAFRAFMASYPETVLLIDTYDTLAGVRKVVDIAKAAGPEFKVRAVRLDSGDLIALSRECRAILDEAGLDHVGIFASGGLDEQKVAEIVAAQAPIDGFGVGTAMGVSEDAPALDIAYKLCAYAGEGRLKLSTGKPILPGRKQVFRRVEDGVAVGDTVGRDGEALPGRPLLQPVMRGGKRLDGMHLSLDAIRDAATQEQTLLPERISAIAPATPSYPVSISTELSAFHAEVKARVGA